MVGYRRAWDMYNDIRDGGNSYVEKLYGKDLVAPNFQDLEDFKGVHRAAVSIIKREEERAKAPKRRKASAENEGYSEPVVEPVMDHWRFKPQTVQKSLVEDKWKADNYVKMCAKIRSLLGANSSAAVDSDAFLDVLRRASDIFLRNESRPVLTNELGDFDNPFMMRKMCTERLLHETCVRNKLEESLVNELLENDVQLIKLKSQAEIPPEVLEPLQAFRGVTDWSFDPETRMCQKLHAVKSLLAKIDSGDTSKKNSKENHLGFVSQVPTGRRGGWAHGKERSQKYHEAIRYPTLQTVAHSLPKDPHYRSQAVNAISILERSRGWTFSDKTKAINSLKEVLDALPSSATLISKLDKALPVSRFTRNCKTSFVRRKPSNLKRRNRIRMYFRSMTAAIPLSRRWTERKAKNQARAKKKDSK